MDIYLQNIINNISSDNIDNKYLNDQFYNIYNLLKKEKRNIKLENISIPQHIINTLIVLFKSNLDKKLTLDIDILNKLEEDHDKFKSYNHKINKLNDILEKKTNILMKFLMDLKKI
jgi:hypothetical protein